MTIQIITISDVVDKDAATGNDVVTDQVTFSVESTSNFRGAERPATAMLMASAIRSLVENDKTFLLELGRSSLGGHQTARVRQRLNKLQALEDAGVDNWEWYGDAIASLADES